MKIMRMLRSTATKYIVTERWLVPALCSGRPWLGPNLVKVYQSELFAAITEGVVLCAHFKLSSDQPACADDSQADAAAQRH